MARRVIYEGYTLTSDGLGGVIEISAALKETLARGFHPKMIRMNSAMMNMARKAVLLTYAGRKLSWITDDGIEHTTESTEPRLGSYAIPGSGIVPIEIDEYVTVGFVIDCADAKAA